MELKGARQLRFFQLTLLTQYSSIHIDLDARDVAYIGVVEFVG